MAKRLYFANTEADNGEPIANGTWSANAGAGSTLKMNRAKTNTAMAEVNTTSTAGQTKWLRAFVSEPLAAQNIAGTFKCYILTKEGASNDEVFLRAELYVTSGSTFSLRGTLLSGPTNYGFATEPTTTATNHSFADGDTLSALDVQDGDRIILKLGFTDVSGTSPNMRIRVGDPTGSTDLPEDESTTTDNCPWCEFSQTLLFQDEVVSPSVVASTSTKPSPTITSDRVSPSVVASTSTKPSPAISGETAPSVVASTSTAPSPTINASMDVGALASTSAEPSPALSGGADVGALASTSAIPSPSIGASADIGALATTGTVQSPAIGATLDVGALATTSTEPSPTIEGSIAPSVIATTSTTNAPALTGYVEPSVIASTSIVGAPAVVVFVSVDALSTTSTAYEPEIIVRPVTTLTSAVPGGASISTTVPAAVVLTSTVSGAASI